MSMDILGGTPGASMDILGERGLGARVYILGERGTPEQAWTS